MVLLYLAQLVDLTITTYNNIDTDVENVNRKFEMEDSSATLRPARQFFEPCLADLRLSIMNDLVWPSLCSYLMN